LIAAFGLEPAQIADAVVERVRLRPGRRGASAEGEGPQ
jgi:hypothetical protein